MTRTSNVESRSPLGPLRVWLKGHCPLNILQEKVLVHPMLSGKGHVSLRQPEPAAKPWLCLADGMCWAGSEQEPPGSCPGQQPPLGTL